MFNRYLICSMILVVLVVWCAAFVNAQYQEEYPGQYPNDPEDYLHNQGNPAQPQTSPEPPPPPFPGPAVLLAIVAIIFFLRALAKGRRD